MSRDEIIREISDYMEQQGGFPSDWYVGVAEDARNALFEDHNVDWQRGRWIYQPAESFLEAEEISEHFLIVVGTDGEDGNGDFAARQVYAYRKSFRTTP
jgi:hypothetical protein